MYQYHLTTSTTAQSMMLLQPCLTAGMLFFSLTIISPIIHLVIVAKKLNLSPEHIWLINVGSCKFQSS